MQKFFNTEGPLQFDLHYAVEPLSRWNLEELLSLIARRKYFVLHAPRQTGKTTCLLALMECLNRRTDYRCLYANIEHAQPMRSDVSLAMEIIANAVADAAELYLQEDLHTRLRILKQQRAPGELLKVLLQFWSEQEQKPTILLLDEVDALVGDTLISLLRQLRAGYNQRPRAFPQSVVLCGVRDVRDYRLQSSREGIITGGSAFNIKAESLRLGSFTQTEVAKLYAQHTQSSGQIFAPGVVGYVFEQTQGQPWLVNALGYQVCFRSGKEQDRNWVITREDLEKAREDLIQRRDTHLDQLIDKLQEPRVHRVIAPILDGACSFTQVRTDDVQYALDLGLVRRSESGVQIANPIYREVIPRELNTGMQYALEPLVRQQWYQDSEGRLMMTRLLESFQQFFREHAESWLERFHYKEVGPQLLLQAYLQRIVNGGGRIEREYGLGRGRTDLLVQWPMDRNLGFCGAVQRIVLELKIAHRGRERTIAEGLSQLLGYRDRIGGNEEAHLLIFDRTADKPWEQKCFYEVRSMQSISIHIWGM